MHHFCTYFDSGYLARGIALYRSLERHLADFTLHVLCLDDVTYDALSRARLVRIAPLRLIDLEAFDRELFATKGRRTLVEYYFTLTSVIPRFLFETIADAEIVTYLDSDLYFFASPDLVFAEMGGSSVAITPHRFTPTGLFRNRYGIYNVGWVSWRRDERARRCQEWYRAKSIEWCCDSVEDDRYADQKYLDQWTARFPGVRSIEQKGANLAPWNNENYQFSMKNGHFHADDDPLVFYHFHGLKSLYELDPEKTSVKDYLIDSSTFDMTLLMQEVYAPYIKAMCSARDEVATMGLVLAYSPRELRHTDMPPLAAMSPTWRHELDWSCPIPTEKLIWRREVTFPVDQRQAMRVRQPIEAIVEFDGGFAGRSARVEALASVAGATFDAPPSVLDKSDGDELVEHTFEVLPRIEHRSWMFASTSEVATTIGRQLSSPPPSDRPDVTDIVLCGSSIAREEDWATALSRLAASCRWAVVDMRTFSGTSTMLASCRQTGASQRNPFWIVNRRDLGFVFDGLALTVMREIVLPNPVRIRDVPELADHRLFLLRTDLGKSSS